MKYTLLLIIIVFFSSCVSYYEAANIDVLVTPDYQLPSGVQDIKIINNTTEHPSKAIHKTQIINLNKSINVSEKSADDDIKLDSATNTFLSNFEIIAKNSPFLNSAKIEKSITPYKLTSANINQQFKAYPCDAIIALEDFSYTNVFSLFYYDIYDSHQREVRITTSSQWSIYYNKQLTKPYTYIIQDTLYWDQEDADRIDCIYQSFWSNATKAMQKITPNWKEVQRLYYTNVFFTLSEAEKYVKDGDWKSAAEIWMAVYDHQTKHTKKKGQMAFNMALYFETTNNIKGAKEWLDTSEDIFQKKKMTEEVELCQLYRKVLNARIEQNKLLDNYFTP